eukprot:14665024-Ditylum_brightwellii.AAC.1
MAKLSGDPNLQYAVSALNFSLALAASVNQKTREFVTRNLGLMSLMHAQRLFANTRLPPFINLAFEESAKKLCNHFHKVHQAMGSSSTPIAFTAGIDATIVVKSWQLLQSHGAIVGGVYPNHFLDVSGKSDKEAVELMKECIAGKYGVQAAE